MSEKQLKPGLLGKKVGMTQFFSADGEAIGVTAIEVGPCVVTQVKNQERDGYNAVQLGFDEKAFRKVNRPMRGHFEKKKLKAYYHLKEFRVNDAALFKIGQALTAECFQVGDKVDVRGSSKGKGFQGVIKRFHKGGGPASHGSHFHRSTGSIGQRTWPGRVFKLMKLPGHMGDKKVTVRNLEIVEVLPEKNLILIRGAIPGANNSVVEIKSLLGAEFIKRMVPKEEKAPKEEVAQPEEKAKEEAAGDKA